MKLLPTKSMESLIHSVKERYKTNDKIGVMFEKCLLNTYQTTLKPQEDGGTFVITGDIPAMWLRDSTAQVRPMLFLAKEDLEVRQLLKGVIETQKSQVLIDPYANAFNITANGQGHQTDGTDMHPQVWERKYEIDSLCYVIQLAWLYWKNTGDESIFDARFKQVAKTIVELWKVEQYHHLKSQYRFTRNLDTWVNDELPWKWSYETLPCEGKGSPVAYTGMTWSGFRPSDDACRLGYLVPSNMFAVVELRHLAEIYKDIYDLPFQAQEANTLADEIDAAIQEFAIVEHDTYGKVYAYEVDGLGNSLCLDDANVPSLLSAPYLGYCAFDDPIYLNTRRLILSKANPFYYEGIHAKGIGSAHTPNNYVWHIALAMQGMTALDQQERQQILNLLSTTDADTCLMHEGFDVDQPKNYTRPWFSWANSMFAEFILSLEGRYVDSTPLAILRNTQALTKSE